MLRRSLDIAFGVLCAGVVLLLFQHRLSPEQPTPTVQQWIQEQGLAMRQLSFQGLDESPSRLVRFAAGDLQDSVLCLVPRAGSEGDPVLIGNRTVVSPPVALRPVAQRVELLATQDAVRVFLDGTLVTAPAGAPAGLDRYDVFLASTSSSRTPPAQVENSPAIEFRDEFMRTRLDNGSWQMAGGRWWLNRNGGGMPLSERQRHRAGFQRSVNPFTLVGYGDGILSCGGANWTHYHAEAAFYFGIPKSGEVVDRDSLPTQTNLLIGQGDLSGRQVAFGWHGGKAAFVLVTRDGTGDWEELARLQGGRPPLTNWVRLGIRLVNGHRAEGWLDGVKVAQADLRRLVRGPVHLYSGKGLVEVDDVLAYSLPEPAPEHTPYYVRSRNFAGKERNNDPVEFDQWAEASNAFRERIARDGGARASEIVTTRPLMGDFSYQPVPYHDTQGKLPAGSYRIAIYALDRKDFEKIPRSDPICRVMARREGRDWIVESCRGIDSAALAQACSSFRIQRRDGRVELLAAEQPVHLADWAGPVYLGIAREMAANEQAGGAPAPEHHQIRCAGLVNELFETAPTEWNWIDGAFRMDTRWACQEQWNFLCCGSTGTPFMSSKRTFHGDQEHEYFMSLRAVMPWDAGDDSFDYNVHHDRRNGFRILKRNGAWYNRHDLNFSFCSNGRDPLSGYAIIFGGDDNRQTMLLRKGTVVAETAKAHVLFPTDPDHHAVHWQWWGFRVRRYGARILVHHRDQVLFDYTDTDPLPGGHIGFWTVRNGFVVARVISLAETVGRTPDVLYVNDDTESAGQWLPLQRDVVTLSPGQRLAGTTRVTANTASGLFGVRRAYSRPIDLRKTPLMRLPLHLPEATRMNLHIQTDRGSFILPVTAPVSTTKTPLTPQHEVGECFRMSRLSDRERKRVVLPAQKTRDSVLQLDLHEALRQTAKGKPPTTVSSITVGNTDNTDYLRAGNGGNASGAWFEVGDPRFL